MTCPPALQGSKGSRDVLSAADFERIDDVKAKRAGCGLYLAHLLYGPAPVDIGQDCHPAEVGDNFAQEFESLASKIGLLVRQAGDVGSWSCE